METAAACEIERLPEELLVHVISLTSPPDACCAAAVSRAFRAAADSDAVWSGFLPRDLPRFAKRELSHAPPSKKGLFLRLSGQPALLPCKYMRMQLDRVTGAKCFTLSASALQISRSPKHSSGWIRLGSNYSKRGKRFAEAAELRYIDKLEICGKIDSKMLSQNSTYVAYLVFKLGNKFFRLDFPFQEASICLAGSESTRQICLQGYVEDGAGAGELPRRHILQSTGARNPHAIPPGEDVVLPRSRADGWMEVELGEFHNQGGDDGEVSISLTETNGGSKGGLTVWGIELRSKQQRQRDCRNKNHLGAKIRRLSSFA